LFKGPSVILVGVFSATYPGRQFDTTRNKYFNPVAAIQVLYLAPPGVAGTVR